MRLGTICTLSMFLAVTANFLVAQNGTPALSCPASDSPEQQSLDDAWWTGPILAQSAGTLPRGHVLIEPYFYDVIANGSHSIGSRAYMLYGLADRFTIGAIPVVGFNMMPNGASSSGMGMGDFGISAQYRLTQFHKERWFPATAFQVQETFPTGKYDRLGKNPADGFGSGGYATTLTVNSQKYFWLPTGRILRMRFDVSETLSSAAHVQGVSVYGTDADFRGHANPGSSIFLDGAWEYSITRNWVPALDITYRHAGNTRVTGLEGATALALNSGSSDSYSFTPAMEYNWTSKVGIIFGARVIPHSHDTTSSVTPVFAINFVH
jgi:hypothetical protein